MSTSGSLATVNLPLAISAATYDANNRLTQWDGRAVAHDADGNVIDDGVLRYSWNERGQLAAVTQAGISVATYAYDAFGRRRQKVVQGTTTKYVYDQFNFVQELDAGNSVIANLLTGLTPDELFARVKGASITTYLTDSLGSVIAESDATGTIQSSYAYEAYGRTTRAGALSDSSQRFTGREQDLADLYYYRARYYSSAFGRFLSEDPMGIAGGTNLYAYANGDPTDYADPDGLAGRGRSGGRQRGGGGSHGGGEWENVGDGERGILCALQIASACIPDEAYSCLRWHCTPKCGLGYDIDTSSRNKEVSLTNPDTPCVCVQKGISKTFNDPPVGLAP